MIDSVEIAFLFISFKRLRLEREQIKQILPDLEQLAEFHISKAVFKASGKRFSNREAALLAIKSQRVFVA